MHRRLHNWLIPTLAGQCENCLHFQILYKFTPPTGFARYYFEGNLSNFLHSPANVDIRRQWSLPVFCKVLVSNVNNMAIKCSSLFSNLIHIYLKCLFYHFLIT